MPARFLSRDEVREIDRRAIEEFELPGIVLMENAGRGAAEVLRNLGIGGPVAIVAGKGNNGGDGFVIARHVENWGYDVSVLLVADPTELRGDALTNFRVLQAAGTPLRQAAGPPHAAALAAALSRADWIVDALLGTGTQGQVREPYVTAIRAINAAPGRVLAVDLPSGLDCDSGRPLGECVRADHTVTFVAPKRGFAAEGAREWTGEVHVVEIGIPRVLLES